MEVTTALELINGLVYKPGWKVSATDHTNRFEGSIILRVDYPAQSTDRVEAREGYPTDITTYAQEPIVVAECGDETALFRCVIDVILKIEEHEAREYFRVEPTFWAPFHPHKIDGMKRWGRADADLKFGIG